MIDRKSRRYDSESVIASDTNWNRMTLFDKDCGEWRLMFVVVQ